MVHHLINNLTNYSLLFSLSLIATVILTYILISRLSSFGVLDVPNQRRAHKNITPRGGGLAIVIVIIIAFYAFEYLVGKNLIQAFKIIPLLILIAGISFLDDIKPLPIYIRLVTHLFCSGVAVYCYLYPFSLFHGELPLYIDTIFSIIGLTAFLNIYNFLDGIDGISSVESIHLSITMLVLCYLKHDIIMNINFIVIINIIILACSIGFLIFNWQPARIFLGDVGSISLGFLLGVCLLFISASSLHLFVACIIAALYYITDGGLTILMRLINKEKIWEPHLKHFFQKAVQNGKTHRQVVSRIAICNIALMVLSILSLSLPLISTILAILVVMSTVISFSEG